MDTDPERVADYLREQVTQPKPTDVGFIQAVVHFYRGEMNRATAWRQRLDTTTNWAVAATAAMLSFAFSSADHGHVTLIFAELMVLALLTIEARRYRYYDVWRTRLRILEEDFIAPILHPPRGGKTPEWADLLARDLHHPRFKMSYNEAFGRRLERNYWFLFAILVLGWLVKLISHPLPLVHLGQLVDRAMVGSIPGPVVLICVGVFHGFLLVVGLRSIRYRQARGEVMPMQMPGRDWRPAADLDHEQTTRYSP